MKEIKNWSEIDNKEFDLQKTYEKSEIAKQQLRTAIWLFLNRVDFASAITLAGASGNILHKLVELENKQPVLEFGRLVCGQLSGQIPAKGKYLKHFGDMTGINRLKHMSEKCPDTIEIDLERSAETAIMRSAMDFVKLYGEADPSIRAFLNYLWITHDGEKMIKEYNTLPESLKRLWG